MQCKWCVIRVVVNDMKYYCFRSENLKGLDNNHTQLLFCIFFWDFNIFGSPPDKFRMLHLVVKSFTHQLFDFMELTLWNMVWKKIINGYYSNTFFYKWQTETKHLSENIHWKKHQLSFIYQISQTDAQTILLNWLQQSLDILGTDESKNRTFPN